LVPHSVGFEAGVHDAPHAPCIALRSGEGDAIPLPTVRRTLRAMETGSRFHCAMCATLSVRLRRSCAFWPLESRFSPSSLRGTGTRCQQLQRPAASHALTHTHTHTHTHTTHTHSSLRESRWGEEARECGRAGFSYGFGAFGSAAPGFGAASSQAFQPVPSEFHSPFAQGERRGGKSRLVHGRSRLTLQAHCCKVDARRCRVLQNVAKCCKVLQGDAR
jgi:hypothetical protein